jgi:hypothetical protein
MQLFKLLFFTLIFTSFVHANRLASETSPYLLQHKNNPVDWYPWGDEAFNKAKKENKLIFLSIGYSTCHWCHEMARESFEDKEIANLLNKDYVAIKVDREQYPHIDKYYQKVYKILKGKSGGWPLTIIMTPDKKPFFAATYIPKYKGYGSQGLVHILHFFSLYSRDKLSQKGDEVLQALQQQRELTTYTRKKEHTLQRAVDELYFNYDVKNKGFGVRPKFPHFVDIIFLLKLYTINHNKQALTMATDTLKAMAKGGIYDQIEGGFFRYSIDEKWLIPHFEKMLYTNGEALQAYSLAYQITKEPLFKKVVIQTREAIDKRFKKHFLYTSASNADSLTPEGEEEEGFYFVFDFDETYEYLIKHHIPKHLVIEQLSYLGITEDGNFDGDASNPHITSTKKPKKMRRTLTLLRQMRDEKKYPFIDNKINTAWNAIYIKGLLQASQVDNSHLQEALHSLDSLLEKFYRDGILYHQTIEGKTPVQKAILEDYSFLISTLFEAYQITLDKKYLIPYKKLLKHSVTLFYKDERWKDSTDKFTTYADVTNGGYTSALSTQISNLILYTTMFTQKKYYKIAHKSSSHFNSIYLASLYDIASPIFIKSTKKNLTKLQIKDIAYPFVYKKVDNSNLFLACKIDSCFSYSKNQNEVIKDIEESLSF